MVFRFAGGVFFILAAVQYSGLIGVPGLLLALVALVAGIALIAGQ